MFRRTFLAAAATLLIAGCATPEVGAPTTDGYIEASSSDHGVNLAAQFAVDEKERLDGEPYELVSVIEAEQRASDGTDYRLVLNVLDSGQSRRAEAEVHQDPLDDYSLTSWIWDTPTR